MSNSLISVILPIYNVAAYIEKCIVSLLNQTYKNFELILVDDCSPDDSIEIALAVFERYHFGNYQLIKHKVNGGAAVGRNTGLSIARGEFIYFMDNDDYAENTLFAEMIKAFDSEDVDIAVCNFWLVAAETGKKEIGFQSPFKGKRDSITAIKALLADKEHSYVWRNLYKRKIFESVRFAERVVYEDTLTMPLLWANARSIYFIPSFLYNYVQRQGSVTTNWRKIEWFYDIVKFMARNEQYFKTHQQLKPLYKGMLIFHYTMLRNFSLQISQGKNDFSLYKEQLERYRRHIKLLSLIKFSLPEHAKLIYQLLNLKLGVKFFWNRYRAV